MSVSSDLLLGMDIIQECEMHRHKLTNCFHALDASVMTLIS